VGGVGLEKQSLLRADRYKRLLQLTPSFFLLPGTRIKKIPVHGSRIRIGIKEFKYF
jgi:hypothetical protein